MTGGGPLAGLRVVELAGLGPTPFAGMMLGDLGADVVRIDRPSPPSAGVSEHERKRTAADPRAYVMNRNRRSVVIDLASADGHDLALRLIARADALIEGYRPGVMERLGLGPDTCLERNPRLVYGRVTGWGQEGPLAQTAGHDINYIAVAGALNSFARRGERPHAPLAYLGDFGGGGMLLAFGVVCGIIEATRSGAGQVIDAAIVDGVAALSSLFYSFLAQGRWQDEREANFADGGAPFYDTYTTSDGGYIAVGGIEQKFWDDMVRRMGVNANELGDRDDPQCWPTIKERLAAVFAAKTRAEWEELLATTDACAVPVLSMTEAPDHPFLQGRGTYVRDGGFVQAAPTPRFSRTPGSLSAPPPLVGEHTDEVLRDWGIDTGAGTT